MSRSKKIPIGAFSNFKMFTLCRAFFEVYLLYDMTDKTCHICLKMIFDPQIERV